MPQVTKADLQCQVRRLERDIEEYKYRENHNRRIIEHARTIIKNVAAVEAELRDVKAELEAEKRITNALMSEVGALRLKHGDTNPQAEQNRLNWYAKAHHIALEKNRYFNEYGQDILAKAYVNPATVATAAKENPILEINLATVTFLQGRDIPLTHFKVQIPNGTKQTHA